MSLEQLNGLQSWQLNSAGLGVNSLPYVRTHLEKIPNDYGPLWNILLFLIFWSPAIISAILFQLHSVRRDEKKSHTVHRKKIPLASSLQWLSLEWREPLVPTLPFWMVIIFYDVWSEKERTRSIVGVWKQCTDLLLSTGISWPSVFSMAQH